MTTQAAHRETHLARMEFFLQDHRPAALAIGALADQSTGLHRA